MTSIINNPPRGASSSCEPLLKLATADLYARNPFRVLGVRVDASRPDIDRILRRRAMAAKLDRGPGAESVAAFPPLPDPDQDRAALLMLGDPIQRFLSEIFWFWPAGDDDEALRALDEGDVDSAIRIWEQAIPTDPVHARHNLAVLHHARALGACAAAPEVGDEGRALELWAALNGERSFWRVVSERAQSAGDIRVSTRLVGEVRETFPVALLLVHARLAVVLARKGEATRAREQVGFLQGAGFDDESTEAALRLALTPPRARLTAAVDRAKKRWEASPPQGADLVVELRNTGLRVLGIIDALLAEDDITRRGIRDDFADVLIDGVVAYGNKTEDWNRAVELLAEVEGIAIGTEVTERLEKNRVTCTENTTSWNHWCAPGYWDLPSATLAELEAARELANVGDFDTAIEQLVGLDPSIGYPVTRALAFCLGREALRIYHERTSAGQRPDGLRLAAEYETLADELDPEHPTITGQLAETRRELNMLGVGMPTSRDLRDRLHGSRSRGEVIPGPDTHATPCHFCGAPETDASAAIEVPLCGDVQVTEYVLGSGTVYNTQTVAIPRCADCLAEHEDLPARIEAWRAGYAVSGSDDAFEELSGRVRDLGEDQEDAERTLERAKERLTRAETATTAATAEACDRCSSAEPWDDGICRDCDAVLYQIGARDTWAAVGVGLALFLNVFFGWGTTVVQNTAVAIAGPGDSAITAAGVLAAGATAVIGLGVWLLFAALAQRRRIERDEVRQRRRQASEVEQAKRAAEAARDVDQARRAVEEAEAVLLLPRQRLEEAMNELEEAKAAARAEYEASCPWPTLSPGISAESDYPDFPPLVHLLADGWGYGATPLSDGTSVREEPEAVVGLVST